MKSCRALSVARDKSGIHIKTNQERTHKSVDVTWVWFCGPVVNTDKRKTMTNTHKFGEEYSSLLVESLFPPDRCLLAENLLEPVEGSSSSMMLGRLRQQSQPSRVTGLTRWGRRPQAAGVMTVGCWTTSLLNSSRSLRWLQEAIFIRRMSALLNSLSIK